MSQSTGTKKIKVNIGFQVAYQIFIVLTPLITSPYLSRVLGAPKLGIFSATFSYINYFELLCKLGIDTYGNREIARCSNNRTKYSERFWNLYLIQLSFSILSVGLYALILIAGHNSFRNPDIMLLQGIWILAAMLDINWLLFGLEDFRATVIRNIAIKLIIIVLIFVCVRSEDDLPVYILIMSGGMVLSQIVTWLYAIRKLDKPVFTKKLYLHYIKPLLYFFIPVLAMSVFHVMDKHCNAAKVIILTRK